MEMTAFPTDITTDLDIEAEVTGAIRGLDILRPTRAEVNISVTNGQVTLTGIVPSIFAAIEAERAARAVPGVVGVSNQLVDDGTLTRHLAHRLATDLRTRGIPPGYRVKCFFGHVTVMDHFADEQTRAAVAEVCRSVNGVRGVKVAAE